MLRNVVGPFVDGSITLAPDGLTLFNSSFNSHKLTLFRTTDLALLQEVDFGANLGSSIMVTPDGTRAYVQRNTGTQDTELLMIPLQSERIISATGILEKQGITTYQYGTHVINDSNSNTFYALSSNDIRLDDYVGLSVTVKGHTVIGYPLENGPQYLNVFSISK